MFPAPMLENLQAWVAGYYERTDQWSYQAHRQIFDSFAGCKSEHHDGTSFSARNLV